MKLGKVKNKTFKYQPRFLKENVTEITDDITSEKNDFISKWNENRKQNRKVKGALSLPIYIVLLLLVLIGLYIANSFVK